MAHGKPRDLRLEARWRKTLARHERSGVTAREFCRRHGITESAFGFWKRELARRDAEKSTGHPSGLRSSGRKGRPRRLPSQVPVTIGPALPHAAPVEVMLPHGVSVRVAADCEEATLRMVLSALERAS